MRGASGLLVGLIVLIGVVAAGYSLWHSASSRGGDDFVRVKPDDARIQAARDEAAQRWPEFIAAFNQKDGHDFMVKYPFPTSSGSREHMWVIVEAIDGDRVRGILDNDPEQSVGHKAGDSVTFEAAGITDWMYDDANGQTIGGFTVKVLHDIQRGEGTGT